PQGLNNKQGTQAWESEAKLTLVPNWKLGLQNPNLPPSPMCAFRLRPDAKASPSVGLRRIAGISWGVSAGQAASVSRTACCGNRREGMGRARPRTARGHGPTDAAEISRYAQNVHTCPTRSVLGFLELVGTHLDEECYRI